MPSTPTDSKQLQLSCNASNVLATGMTQALPADMSQRRHEWSIGLFVGTSPWDFSPPVHIHNPVLTCRDVSDVLATFVADPFMLKVERTWYMFFEVLNARTDKGEIGLASSEDGVTWHYQHIVLTEPFHLSYPYVFAWDGAYYMIPESHQAGAVRLYRAHHFPYHWSYVTTLLRGSFLVDASICRYDDTWWLFAETNPDCTYDTLRLYYAPTLTGPWQEHPQSPIVTQNAHIARPAGRVLVSDTGIVRYAQDCSPIYGLRVYAFATSTLTTTCYQEHACTDHPILTGSSTGWRAVGMHHIDPHRLADNTWLACVDGFCWHESPPAADTATSPGKLKTAA